MSFFTILPLILSVALFIFISIKEASGLKYKLLFQSVLVSVFINLFLNLNFYPLLLKYQSGSETAFFIDKNSIANLPVAQLQEEEYAHALEFYLNQPLFLVNEDGKGNLPAKPYLLYTSKEHIDQLYKVH